MKPLKLSQQSALLFELQGSRYFIATLLSIYLGAIACLSKVQIPVGVKAMSALICTLYLIYLLYAKGLLLAHNTIISIQYCSGKVWNLFLRNGKLLQASLRGDSFISPKLCILNFNARGYFFPLSIVLFQDSLNKDSFRQLSITVRFMNDQNQRGHST